MKELIQLLDSGNFSCVIANGNDTRTFSQRGVADLHNLTHNEPQFLKGAIIVDKIVGKGAAALMINGKIKQLFTRTISQAALDIFEKSEVKVEYEKVVPHIINRTQTGMCPLETRCQGIDSIDELILIINNFVDEMNNNIK